ncbi:hypothetical protein [Gordonia terrae]|nr:hypothetical protein [Gordonia terrae]
MIAGLERVAHIDGIVDRREHLDGVGEMCGESTPRPDAHDTLGA